MLLLPFPSHLKMLTALNLRRVSDGRLIESRRYTQVPSVAHEPVIGHIKIEHRMGRNYLAYAQGDGINAILAAAGYNLSLLLTWLKQFL